MLKKKKFLILIMCTIVTLLTACGQSNISSDAEEQDNISDIQYSPPLYSTYDFNTYEEIIQALTMSGTESYNMIRQKQAHLELSEVYMNTLSAFETGGIKLAVPQIDGEDISFEELGEGFSNITLFSGELYELPWIWYHCVVDDFELTVRVCYISALDDKNIEDVGSALEALKILDPDEDYKQFDYYEHIYEQEIQLSDRKAKALIIELNDDPRIYVDVYYDGVYIRLVSEKEVLSRKFFKKFSIRYAS